MYDEYDYDDYEYNDDDDYGYDDGSGSELDLHTLIENTFFEAEVGLPK